MLKCSSNKSFIVPVLTFRSFLHFEFVFVYGVTDCSTFTLLHVAVQSPLHHLLKRLYFLHCHRLGDQRYVGLSLQQYNGYDIKILTLKETS